MPFAPPFWSTTVGSFPQIEYQILVEQITSSLDIPTWPQLPRRSFLENMYVQFSAQLPRIVLDKENEKITFDTSGDLTTALLPFYEEYLAEKIDAFALDPDYATGFYVLLEALKDKPGDWVKGQVTGPISQGLTITDQNLQPSLYHEQLADVLVKNAAMIARWQARELNKIRPKVIISVDEPYMASFGSAYISLSRERAIHMLEEVFTAIHQEGALAGVHCCANTDWSVLLSTSVDILNLDAYGYLEQLALYPDELNAFLKRGGVIAWGIIPNTELIFETSAEKLANQLRQGIEMIREKAVMRGIQLPETLTSQGLITPSCGLGPSSEDVSTRVMEMLIRLSDLINQD